MNFTRKLHKNQKTPSDHSFITRPHDCYVTLEIQKAAMVWYHVYFIVVTMLGTRGQWALYPNRALYPTLPYLPPSKGQSVESKSRSWCNIDSIDLHSRPWTELRHWVTFFLGQTFIWIFIWLENRILPTYLSSLLHILGWCKKNELVNFFRGAL